MLLPQNARFSSNLLGYVGKLVLDSVSCLASAMLKLDFPAWLTSSVAQISSSGFLIGCEIRF